MLSQRAQPARAKQVEDIFRFRDPYQHRVQSPLRGRLANNNGHFVYSQNIINLLPRFVKRLQQHRSLAYGGGGFSVLAQFIKGNSCDLSPPPLLQSISVSSLSAVCRPDPPMPQNLSAGQKSFLYDGLLTAITSDNAANRAFHPKSLQVRSFSLGACLLQVLFCLFLRRSEI